MKLKSKLIPTIMLGLIAASLPIAALSSCSGNTSKVYTLNKYYDEKTSLRPMISAETIPVSINMDEQLIFDINPSVFEKKEEEAYKNSTWQMGVVCKMAEEEFKPINIKDASITIKVSDA